MALQVNEISSTNPENLNYGFNKEKYTSWVDQLIDESGDDGISPEELAAVLDTKYDEITIDGYLLQLQEEGQICYYSEENVFKYERDERDERKLVAIKLINPEMYWNRNWRFPELDEEMEMEIAVQK